MALDLQTFDLTRIGVGVQVMRGALAVCSLFSCLGIALATQAESQVPISLKKCGDATVQEVLSSDQFRTSAGDTIVLADIKTSEYWGVDSGYKSWPFGARSKAYLERMIMGQTVVLHCGDKGANVFGDKIRHIELPDGHWLQHKMVHDGMAAAYSSSVNDNVAEALFDAEDQAQADARGIWSERGPKLVANTESAQTGFFQIVRFTVHQTADVRGTLYINTSADWRKDFTVEVGRRVLRQFDERELDTLLQPGTSLEVRGWVFSKNGPTIALKHPAHIRVLRE